jgi:stringent starvation protein B
MFADKKTGVVRIPLDRAMNLFAQEAAEGKLFYPAKSYVPKKEEPAPAAPGAAPGAAPASAPAAAAPAK